MTVPGMTCQRCTAPATARVRSGTGPWVGACDTHLAAVQRDAGVPRTTELIRQERDEGQGRLW